MGSQGKTALQNVNRTIEDFAYASSADVTYFYLPMKISNKIILIFSLILFFLSLGEITIRLYQIVSGKGGYVWLPDDYLGVTHAPNSTFLYKECFSNEFLIRRRTNALGLVGNQISIKKPNDMIRILMLGDSFCEGLHVEEGKNFCEQLQHLLNYATLVPGKKFEVINAGVSSYSPISEYVFLKRELAKLRPDIIILQLYANDVFEDNKVQAMSQLGKDGLPIRIKKYFDNSSYPSEPTKLREEFYRFKRFILSKSILSQSLYRSIKHLSKKASFNKKMNGLPQFLDGKQFFIMQDCDPLFQDVEFRNKTWRQTKKYILAIRDFTESINAKFSMFYIPAEAQLSLGHYGENTIGYFKCSPNLYLNNKLAELCREENIRFLNMLPALETNKDKGLYYSKDGHTKEVGHRLIAQELLNLVSVLLQAS